MPDDAQLFDAWRRGDARAGRVLIERHYDAVLRFFSSKVGVVADELVAETFTLCGDGEPRDASSFRAFLFGIARSVLLRHFRQLRGGDSEQDVAGLSSFDVDSGPSSLTANSTGQRLLFEALRRIEVDLQVALELAHWDGLTVDELATVFAESRAAVEDRLQRARARLREALEELPATADEHRSVTALLGDLG